MKKGSQTQGKDIRLHLLSRRKNCTTPCNHKNLVQIQSNLIGFSTKKQKGIEITGKVKNNKATKEYLWCSITWWKSKDVGVGGHLTHHRFGVLGQSKIANHSMNLLCSLPNVLQQNVGWLDVTMNKPKPMHRTQGRHNLLTNRKGHHRHQHLVVGLRVDQWYKISLIQLCHDTAGFLAVSEEFDLEYRERKC